MLMIMPPRKLPRDHLKGLDEVKVAHSLSFLINKLAQVAGKGMSEALDALRILPRESGVLAAIAEFGPQSQQRLGELLLIDRTTVVLAIDHLEELGFVERTAHATDRRVFLIKLTSKGRAATAEAKRSLEAFEARLLHPLGVEASRFREMLLRVVRPALDPALTGAPQTEGA